jgi:hypothetical protein
VSFTVRPPLNQNYTLVSFSTRRDVIGRLVKYWMGCGLALCCIYNTTSLAIAQGNESVSPQRRDFEAAKQEYERSPRDEAARLTYVTRLAGIADPLVAEYRQSGRRHDELMTLINSEWQKHPVSRDIDSKKLRKLLVGKWDSPRRTYVFRADGKCGAEDGPISSNWQIEGNRLIWGDASGTIILLNNDYFIYAGDHDAVFFHTRVKE